MKSFAEILQQAGVVMEPVVPDSRKLKNSVADAARTARVGQLVAAGNPSRVRPEWLDMENAMVEVAGLGKVGRTWYVDWAMGKTQRKRYKIPNLPSLFLGMPDIDPVRAKEA